LPCPRVLLADDHPRLLEAVTKLLSPTFEVVGTASNGAELVSLALRLNPEVIVADISMPEVSGIEAIHQLRESGSLAKIVILTVHSEDEFVKACMAAGGLGYVLKSCMKTGLVPAIQAALKGQSYIAMITPQ
jgi:DNA-binding NarL/FixJ family response regulator